MRTFDDINQALANLNGKNQPGTIYVDNLHTPYIRFSESFVLPASSTIEPEFSAKVQFVKTLFHFLPEAINGTSLLAEPRPKKDIGKLFFLRPILLQNKQFLYIFSSDFQYLGGSTPPEVREPATQNRTPAIETDRIYFQVKVIPIEPLPEMQGSVSDFQPLRFKGGIFNWKSEREPNRPVRRFSEIFDEMDFSEMESKIREELGMSPSNWAPGNIYQPIGIDYLSLSLRFLMPNLSKTVFELKNFYQILEPGDSGVPQKSIVSFQDYLSRHQTERTVSKSGNILWKINFTDLPKPKL